MESEQPYTKGLERWSPTSERNDVRPSDVEERFHYPQRDPKQTLK